MKNLLRSIAFGSALLLGGCGEDMIHSVPPDAGVDQCPVVQNGKWNFAFLKVTERTGLENCKDHLSFDEHLSSDLPNGATFEDGCIGSTDLVLDGACPKTYKYACVDGWYDLRVNVECTLDDVTEHEFSGVCEVKGGFDRGNGAGVEPMDCQYLAFGVYQF